MIMKLIDAQIDASMMAKTILQDDFGNKGIVQTPLNKPGADHAAEVAAMEATMQANQDAFVANLLAMGKTQEQIDALKVG